MKSNIAMLLFTLIVISVNGQIPKPKFKAPNIKKTNTTIESLAGDLQNIKGSLVAPNSKHYFFTDKRYFRYSDKHGLEKIANTKPNWSGIPDNIDAVFVNPDNNKAYFFKGNKYNRWDFKNGKDNSELLISRFWEGVPNDIDAATNHPNGKIYFFKDDTYYRYDTKSKKVDRTALISKYWKGVPNNVAAALLHENGKIYFFKENKYYRYNIESGKVDNVGKGTIGINGWKGLDFEKKNFTKKLDTSIASSKDNIRLKVTLTRIKSIQARDSDNIADFLFEQNVSFNTKGNQKLAIDKNIKVGYNKINTDDESTSIISIGQYNQMHVREGDEKHFINNSVVYEIIPQEIADKRAEFKILTKLQEYSGIASLWSAGDYKSIAKHGKSDIEVSIYEVIDYLQNPNASKYGKSYFNGGPNRNYHEYGALGDVMWFKKGSNNSLLGFLEFGDNNKETYVRLYYRFELVP